MNKSKRIAYFALNVALAFVLSYLESLVPVNIGVPGIKLGLANLVVVTALYTLPKQDAFFISMVRIILSGLTFGGVFSLIYSLAGGILSFAVMLCAKRIKGISVAGVSVLGAAVHNIGQIIAAAIVMKNSGIFYYLPVLLISGGITGLAIGIVSRIIINRISGYKGD